MPAAVGAAGDGIVLAAAARAALDQMSARIDFVDPRASLRL